ncbi:MAG: glycosyltransferase family 4 protein [Actinomycetota bacterium]|nr:glycosyltransferase family 4 protein [Actinomycetota bacterium]
MNLLWLVPGVVGGSEDSVTGALRAVAALDEPDLDLRLAVLESFPSAHPDLAAAFTCEVNDLSGANKVRRVLAEQTWLARMARRTDAQVVHHAGGVAPLVSPARNVLTIHDLQPLDLPANFTRTKRAYISSMVGRSARGAEVVCVPSEFTRSRVVDLLGVAPERVRVVPWFVEGVRGAAAGGAVDGRVGGAVDGAVSRAVSGAVDPEVPSGPYFLYPAITYPHKQHVLLVDAFAIVARADPSVTLVLTGGEGPSEAAVRDRIASHGLGHRVLRAGRVSRDHLEALYAGAAAVTVPSNYEGFGLPALEAMVRGRPVLAAAAGSLPEVVAPDSLVDPVDVTAWADAMQSVLQLSTQERAARIALGHELAARFSPHRTATDLLSAYRRAAASSR